MSSYCCHWLWKWMKHGNWLVQVSLLMLPIFCVKRYVSASIYTSSLFIHDTRCRFFYFMEKNCCSLACLFLFCTKWEEIPSINKLDSIGFLLKGQTIKNNIIHWESLICTFNFLMHYLLIFILFSSPHKSHDLFLFFFYLIFPVLTLFSYETLLYILDH